MSLPFYEITCSGCGFRYLHTYKTHYIYKGNPSRKPVLQIAWCRDCNEIIMACTPYTLSYAKYEIEQLNMLIGKNEKGFFGWISPSKRKAIEESKRQARKKLDEVNERLKYFDNAEYKARCLQCHGYSVYPFELPSGDYCIVEKLEIEHLCGGQLLVSIAGRIGYVSHPKVVYDENGIIVHDERKQKG